MSLVNLDAADGDADEFSRSTRDGTECFWCGASLESLAAVVARSRTIGFRFHRCYNKFYRRWLDMINEKKICVVLPAYNAGRTLEKTLEEIPSGLVDDIILVDDASKDNTIEIAQKNNVFTCRHDNNKGYGGNQKTCYRLALQRGADLVIMLHPDYQYTPKLLLPMASLLESGFFDVVLGSRILGVGALAGGMPLYKYLSNRILTLIQNLVMSHKLSEYHTGYRGFTKEVLEDLPFDRNSDDFVFDNEILSQAIYRGFRIGEVSCPTSYSPQASSINFVRSVVYGLGVLKTALAFRMACIGFDRRTVFEGLRRRRSIPGVSQMTP
jgi:glycosyltransferase involved in cell wall biosynthesis